MGYRWILLALACCQPVQALSIYGELLPGLAYYDEQGRLTGLSVDIVRAVQQQIGNEDPLRMVAWARGLSLTRQAEDDVLLFATGFTEDRRADFQWVGPIYDARVCLTALKDSPIQPGPLNALDHKLRVGVVRGDLREDLLRGEGFTQLVTVDNDNLSVKMLVRGRIDLWSNSDHTSRLHLAEAGLAPDAVKLIYCGEPFGIYLSFSLSTNPAVVEQWRQGLDGIKQDGRLATILQRYGLDMPTTQIPALRAP